MDIYKLKEFHKLKNAVVTLAVREVTNVGRYGQVLLDENSEVVKFLEKSGKKESGFINAGVYVINKDALAVFEKDIKFSLEQDYFMKQLNINKIFAKEFRSYFIDIGVPSEYEKANTDFVNFWK